MNYKKILGVFIIIVLSFILIKIFSNNKKEVLIRKSFDLKQKDKSYNYKVGKKEIIITIKFNKRINIQIDKISSTIKGIIIKKGKKIILKPFLKGKFILNFSSLQILTKKDKSELLISHKRGKNILNSFYIKGYNKILISNINLYLEKQDSLIFSSRGNLISIVSEPVFIKKKTDKKRYVFLIGVDTLRRDRIGIYNKSKNITPNIDKFSKDSVVFTNAFSSAPWTLPAFMSMATGLYAPFHGSNYGGNVINKKINILFNIVRKQFIIYGITGDYFLSYRFGFSQGTDLYVEDFRDGINTFSARDLFNRTKKIIKA